MPTPKEGYILADGSRVPGTTTILGRWKESGGLLFWAHGVGYEQGKANRAPRLYEQRDAAADVGTHIHAMVEWHLEGEQGEAPKPPAELNPADVARGLNGYQQFLAWENQTKVEIVSWEKPLVSERHRYGLTPDGLFIIDGKVAMGDWKSSKKVYADNLLQLAAYWIGWDENFPDNPITGGAHIVRFSKDYGDFEHRYFESLNDEKAQFLLLRQAYENDLKLKKRI
jgi:hypothetical protein